MWNSWGTKTCSCQKNRLKCVTACEDCQGESCEEIFEAEEENGEEENFDL